jgi:hypothetical protein
VRRASNSGKIFLSIACGILVAAFTAGTHWFTVPHDHGLMVRIFMGDFVAALAAIILCLALQLRQEDTHFVNALSSVTIVSELNHHIRSAVFRLCLIVQKIGDRETSRLADEAVEQINAALRDATADAISGPRRD